MLQVFPKGRLGYPHAQTLRPQTLPVYSLQATLHRKQCSGEPHAHAHARETVQVHHLWRHVLTIRQPQESLVQSQWGQDVQLWTLQLRHQPQETADQTRGQARLRPAPHSRAQGSWADGVKPLPNCPQLRHYPKYN